MHDHASIEGLRPQNAMCPTCGYVPGGQAIRDGKLTCPECGEEIRFELVKPVRSRRVRVLARSISLVGMGIIVGVGLVVWSQAGGRPAGLYWGFMVLVLVVSWVVGVMVMRGR
jgi:hypothetical protein